MAKKEHNKHGATPLPKGSRKRGQPLFKKPKEHGSPRRDRTGQTDTSLTHMKQRLSETPKKSAGSEHDQHEFDEDHGTDRE